ncbi:Uncharacterised protein [Bordetella pertussis]|nr:Uncharacterised protein [Bordetella pertussis]
MLKRSKPSSRQADEMVNGCAPSARSKATNANWPALWPGQRVSSCTSTCITALSANRSSRAMRPAAWRGRPIRPSSDNSAPAPPAAMTTAITGPMGPRQ